MWGKKCVLTPPHPGRFAQNGKVIKTIIWQRKSLFLPPLPAQRFFQRDPFPISKDPLEGPLFCCGLIRPLGIAMEIFR